MASAPPPRSIFYSWQSDLPNSTNRGFIERALKDAAGLLRADDSLGVEPVVERDTLGVPGAPDIAATILAKIAAADVFVADVSIIHQEEGDDRRTPNPNVLIELGWALRALGFERVVLVMNTAFGGPELLPFDLRARRAVLYQLPADAAEKANVRRDLASKLKAALEPALIASAAAGTESLPSSADRAIEAIEAAKPSRQLAIRAYCDDLVAGLDSLAPPPFRDGGTVEQLEQAIEATIPIVFEFTRVAQVAAVMNDESTAAELFRVFSPVFERYNTPQGFSGKSDRRDYDYYHVLGHELVVSLFACLLREGRWELIGELFAARIDVTNQAAGYGAPPVDFSYGDHAAESLLAAGQERRRVSLHADILSARHESEPLRSLMPLQDFVAADYFLFLRAELSPADAPTGFFAWRPWSALYLREPPAFLRAAERIKTATRICAALGLANVETLRERLSLRAKRIGVLFSRGLWHDPLASFDVGKIGSRE